MSKQDFFKPISTTLQTVARAENAKTVGSSIRFLNTDDDFTEYLSADIAILGLTNSENIDYNNIREKFYKTYIHAEKLDIVDLGDISITEKSETELEEMLILYSEKKTLLIILGGEPQDIQHIIKGIDSEKISATSISSNINLDSNTNIKYLYNANLFNINALAYQLYITNPQHLEQMSSKYYNTTRLGVLRGAMLKVEPGIRDSDLLCIDINSVRNSDSPSSGNPNGLYAEEVCQLSRYAGLSENLKIAYINGFNTNTNSITISLMSQIIWHIMDGYVHRIPEKMLNNANGVQKIIVNLESPSRKLLFFHSNLTKRWWMEVNGADEHSSLIIACLREDYTNACNHELPLKWLWYHQKMLKQSII